MRPTSFLLFLNVLCLLLLMAAACSDEGSAGAGGSATAGAGGGADAGTGGDGNADASADANADADTGAGDCLEEPWSQHLVEGAFPGANDVLAADIDGDGDMDIVGSSPNPLSDVGKLSWWENTDGSGAALTEHTVEADFNSGRAISVADIDGDGDLDIVGGHRVGAIQFYVSWFENLDGSGAAWTGHLVTYFTSDVANAIVPADFYGDGHVDVVTLGYSYGDVFWFNNSDGTGTDWFPHQVDDSFNSALGGDVVDLDGDGDLDIVGSSSADITWFENTSGSGTAWTRHTVDGSSAALTYAVHAADVDGDGDPDLVGAANNDWDETVGFVIWWENLDGAAGSWTEHTVSADLGGARSVFAADLDGDSDLDLIAAGSHADRIAWWENDGGGGINWVERSVAEGFDGAYAVFAADVNGDGATDVLGAAYTANEIAWWQNPCD